VVLHQIYAKVLAGQEASARDRIQRALARRNRTPVSAGHVRPQWALGRNACPFAGAVYAISFRKVELAGILIGQLFRLQRFFRQDAEHVVGVVQWVGSPGVREGNRDDGIVVETASHAVKDLECSS
jgi:hypothetical protein